MQPISISAAPVRGAGPAAIRQECLAARSLSRKPKIKVTNKWPAPVVTCMARLVWLDKDMK
ncbi:hypothetical protein OUZ56_030152 [Daphnia magna]|uniref:Uncharacterized protein n=1 Tax=Daphnia magna TaxID=35525 RepID=A0ABQ9ZQE8_9CRUS|nr:hypothetical protein OUZ56_030152 [Daphnia magna]